MYLRYLSPLLPYRREKGAEVPLPTRITHGGTPRDGDPASTPDVALLLDQQRHGHLHLRTGGGGNTDAI